MYAEALSDHEFSTQFVENTLGQSVTLKNKASAVIAIEQMMASGDSRADIMFWATTALTSIDSSDTNWGTASQQFNNQVEAARYYSIDKEKSSTHLATLQAVTSNITDNAESVITLKTKLDSDISEATSIQQSILQITQIMFNATPGAAYLQEFSTFLKTGTLQDLVNLLADTDIFKSTMYAKSLSDNEFATQFVENTLGAFVTLENKASAVIAIEQMMTSGDSRADVMLWTANTLASINFSDVNWGAAAQRFNYQVEAASYYSIDKEISSNNLPTLQAAIKDITDDITSLMALKSILDGDRSDNATSPPLPDTEGETPIIDDKDTSTIENISIGIAPHSITEGSFNHDGHADLAITDATNNAVVILLRNDENTGFDVQEKITTNEFPISLDIGDFNHDGQSDLIVANYFANSISIFTRNDENTGFEHSTEIATKAFPFAVTVGDFNNDNQDDFAIINKNSYSVSIFLYDESNAEFKPAIDIETGRSPTAMVVDDFNNDGQTDFAVTNADSDSISVLLRNADNIGFEDKIDLDTGMSPWAIDSADFNGDQQSDLVVVNADSNTVSVLLRNADNTGFEAKKDFITGEIPESVKVGDFNNDGQIDLAVVNSESDSISILLRNASNTGFEDKFDVETGSLPHELSVGDFDNSGQIDLAVTNIDSNDVTIIQNIYFDLFY